MDEAGRDSGRDESPRWQAPTPNVTRTADLNRLQDDTLLWTVDIRDTPTTMNGCYTFRSTDGGHTWQGPILMIDWGSEGRSRVSAVWSRIRNNALSAVSLCHLTPKK